MDIDIENNSIKRLQRSDIHKCLSFWDFEERNRIEFDVFGKCFERTEMGIAL